MLTQWYCSVCRRSDDADGVPDEWTPAEVYEAREHGVDKITRADGKEWWS